MKKRQLDSRSVRLRCRCLRFRSAAYVCCSRAATLIGFLLILASSTVALAQQIDEPENKLDSKPPVENQESDHSDQVVSPTIDSASTTVSGLSYSDPITVKWKVGVRIIAGPTDVFNVFIAIPIPNEWPEQTVLINSENMPPSVGNVTYGNLKGGIRRQLIKIPMLRAREDLEISTTFRVSISQINAPPDTTQFVKPAFRHKEVDGYLTPSKSISFNDSKLRNQLKSLVAEKETTWQEVEAIFDWVRDNIDQKDIPNTDAIKAFRKKEGNEEDKVGLFIAFCRCHKIPARMVWVDGGCYAEFMLVDANDKAHWFPCNLVGVREFGSLSEPRIILQKGDNIKVPEKDLRQRFVAEHVRWDAAPGSVRPVIECFRELLPADN